MLYEQIRKTKDEKKNILDQRKLSKIVGAAEPSLFRFLNELLGELLSQLELFDHIEVEIKVGLLFLV